jgi:uncharacterized membrane protein YbaN (DUF454 family)
MCSDPELELFLARKKIRSRPVRWLLIGAGYTALGLGILGIPLPVLPTTPFLLLAAWCFGRSSERLLRWLLTNRLFGTYLRNYVQHKGIPQRVKVYILCMLWLTIGLSAFLAVHVWWLRVSLLATAVGVTVHILRIRTQKPPTG